MTKQPNIPHDPKSGWAADIDDFSLLENGFCIDCGTQTVSNKYPEGFYKCFNCDYKFLPLHFPGDIIKDYIHRFYYYDHTVLRIDTEMIEGKIRSHVVHTVASENTSEKLEDYLLSSSILSKQE